MSKVHFLLDHLSGLIFPRSCLSCERALNVHELDICMLCEAQIPLFDFESANNVLSLKFLGKQRLDHTIALYDFQKKTAIQQLIHALKYQNSPEIGYRLGEKLGDRLVKSSLNYVFDMIIPVPLHSKRLKERGYNQSLEIARGLEAVVDIKVDEDLLQRRIYNYTQTKKSKLDRWSNVNSIFKTKQAVSLEGKHVLLVDDIITTGSTVEACCQELEKLNPRSISIAAIAVAK